MSTKATTSSISEVLSTTTISPLEKELPIDSSTGEKNSTTAAVVTTTITNSSTTSSLIKPIIDKTEISTHNLAIPSSLTKHIATIEKPTGKSTLGINNSTKMEKLTPIKTSN
jgi:hypothetical protein